jgi:hypothetical protein
MICDHESCCAIPADTLNHPRHHAVRARSRLLTKIGSMSSPEFRLSQIAREASSARTIATQANGVLAGTELKERIDVHYLEAIEQVCRDVVSSMGKSQSA